LTETDTKEKDMAMAAVSISPGGVGTSVGEHVAAALAVLEEQDAVRFEVGPMFTTLEGDLGAIFELVLGMREAVFTKGAPRCGIVLKVDERRDKAMTTESKMASVRAALAKGQG
jgi:uncharacterized protein (TIGR00106 family)